MPRLPPQVEHVTPLRQLPSVLFTLLAQEPLKKSHTQGHSFPFFPKILPKSPLAIFYKSEWPLLRETRANSEVLSHRKESEQNDVEKRNKTRRREKITNEGVLKTPICVLGSYKGTPQPTHKEQVSTEEAMRENSFEPRECLFKSLIPSPIIKFVVPTSTRANGVIQLT